MLLSSRIYGFTLQSFSAGFLEMLVTDEGFCESYNFEFCEDMVVVQKDLFETHTLN
jgi:hypothetical protein